MEQHLAQNHERDQLLHNLYGDPSDHIARLVKTYKEIYYLPTLKGSYPVSAKQLDGYFKPTTFVVVAVINQQREIAVIPHMPGGKQYVFRGSRLVGGAVDEYSTFCLERAANEYVRRQLGCSIIELTPLAHVENTFTHRKSSVHQSGIAFSAVIGSAPLHDREHHWYWTRHPPEDFIYKNGEVFALCEQNAKDRRHWPPLQEVEAAARGWWKTRFHERIFKPLVNVGSSNIIRSRIMRHIDAPTSVLDVSAGDDALILDICDLFDPDIAVANDIAWYQMRSLRDTADRRQFHLLFTNHNICEMPYKHRFDVVVCKNTLHHIETRDEMVSVLEKLKIISKRLIVIDIEEPRRSRKAKLFNFYYSTVYGDAATDHRFLTQNKFKNLLRLSYPSANIKFDSINTIKGRYLMAVIDFE